MIRNYMSSIVCTEFRIFFASNGCLLPRLLRRVGHEADLAHTGALRGRHGLGHAFIAHVLVAADVQGPAVVFLRLGLQAWLQLLVADGGFVSSGALPSAVTDRRMVSGLITSRSLLARGRSTGTACFMTAR